MTSKKSYWNNFYNKSDIASEEPSSFCSFVMDYFKGHNILNVLDAGCGNGRDSYHLSSKFAVVGVDSSGYKPPDAKDCKFYVSDFCSYDKTGFNLIYLRFTFHSIANEDHSILLESIKDNTYLCIETRSDKGLDTHRYHGDDHYRNFTNLEYLVNILKEYNFETIYMEENEGLAIYKNENPICIRVICRKIAI